MNITEDFRYLQLLKSTSDLSMIERAEYDVYKYGKVYHIRDMLQSRVTKVLEKPENVDVLIQLVIKTINKNIDILNMGGPFARWTFDKPEKSVLWELFSTSEEELLDIFKNHVYPKTYNSLGDFKTIVKNIHNILLICIMTSGIVLKNDRIIESSKYLLMFSIYPLVHSHFWPVGVDQAAMRYTMENLPSKYLYKSKKLTTIQSMLIYQMNKGFELWNDRLIEMTDNAYIDAINSMRMSIYKMFKGINIEYYNNKDNNATHHIQAEVDEEGKSIGGDGKDIDTITYATINKITTNKNIDLVASKISAESSSVDAGNVTSFVSNILSTEENKLDIFVKNIIQSYFDKNNDLNIGSEAFFVHGITLFKSISISKNQIYIELREIINHWMNNIIKINDIYKSPGTSSRYSKAVFMYFIYIINKINK